MVQVKALTYLWKPVNLNTITLLNPRIVAVARLVYSVSEI